jgi:hypothetical protein
MEPILPLVTSYVIINSQVEHPVAFIFNPLQLTKELKECHMQDVSSYDVLQITCNLSVVTNYLGLVV